MISGLPVSLSLRPAKLLASLTDPTCNGPTETFTPGLSTGRSPFPPPGMTTVVAGRLHRRDLHPLAHQLASLQPPIIPYGGFSPVRLKAGLSGSAFAHASLVKPTPGILSVTPALRLPFVHSVASPLRSALCRNNVLGGALPCEELSPLPQRPSLRSGLYCPSPSSLNRPHAPHSWAPRNLDAMRFICDAFAVRCA